MKMPFTPAFSRDIAVLWFQAPMVIAMRTQAMCMAMMTGSTKEMAEFNRMVTEKAAAAAESAIEANFAIARQGIAAASAMASGAVPASAAAAMSEIAHAAVKPYSKRVRSNTRRLSRKKKG